ncbi:HD-GYP domain, c-di-GMP phosphodiesterase class II (or its inactivated variant) [Caminicella sporogenes DSM 14501]|uniref:HD-GYP domain, c-di-GMP phosphodiesterase class II (Or its inactivated variant) n=1 Tax=Caminicella sporogenes DSM 14501 TaxID=1121266 RepID=A0A1M6RV19_9FIRM|nr:HD domain-containing phosphohydrolase [Caminicella sporogenes]RKD23640.1 hypothetical protein BET04_04385 [Caminicella sporogenes]SHK36250.1 HD-GYP domain, c-di-GMP phosphodiesterase class II (or its inactivated variant) [Caminicella sporogenes DSM 14501]
MGFDKYFEPLKLDNIDKSLEFELRNFLIEKNISYCLFFSIINNMAVRIINIKKDEKEEIQYNFSEFLNLDIQRENGIYKLITEKKSIINFQNSNIKTYVKGLKYEIYIPITFKDEIVGCIYLGANEGDNLSLNSDIMEIYEIIKRHMFYIMNIKAEKILYKVLIENIILINKIFEEKTPFMTRHSYNVAAWAIQIARELNYSDERLTEIYLAALMHDIGKIYIDSEIVNKGDDLNEEEYEEAKKHVEIGYNIAKDILITFNAQIPIWILQHHERWNGTGYPNKLKGEEITEEARILKVANFLDKIISKSNYKNEKGIKDILEKIKSYRGKDFDPDIADIAINILRRKLNFEIKDELILPANLILKTRQGLTSFNGYITSINRELIFKLADIHSIKFEDVESIYIAVENLNVIYEFKVSVRKVDTNKLAVEIISLKDAEETFSLLWLLSGVIIDINTKNSKEITISKISGRNLTFSLNSGDKLEKDKLFIVVVIFEDGTKIPLSGKIVNQIKINNVVHYEFEFVGIKESYRDEIFRQIFRKQISIRKTLMDY